MDYSKRTTKHILLTDQSKITGQFRMQKNVLILEGYDGLAGDRSLALEALQRNKQILKTISEIEQKIVLCVASGGGSTGSGNLPYICDILAADSERIVVPIVLMPRKDEPIQKG